MNALRLTLAVVGGALSALLTEVVGFLWMRAAPRGIDLTGSYFLSIAVPATLTVHVLAALILWRVFAANPVRNGAAYVITHALAQATLLAVFNNPPVNVALQAAIVLASGTLVIGTFRRFLWASA